MSRPPGNRVEPDPLWMTEAIEDAISKEAWATSSDLMADVSIRIDPVSDMVDWCLP